MATQAKSDLDLDALRAKYREERDKRIREDGENQYVEAGGEFASYSEDDPYADPDFSRDPLDLEIDVAIIGGGFSGMMAAARMRERGFDNLKIIETGSDFGGTWYWNRYPGAQCDIESYCYLPLLEEMGYMPKEKYSFAPEIFAHSQAVGKYYDLYKDAIFQTRVKALRWDEELKRWRIETNRDDDIRARFVVTAVGPASRPKLPGIPGIEEFEGHSFHTSRWDYDYTGGDHSGGLTKLADKRVGIIGTGATAIQCVPYLAEHAEALYVFQRTPSVVDLRGNSETDPDWYQSLEPGWQRRRRENFAGIIFGEPQAEDLVNDGWTDLANRVGFLAREKMMEGGTLDPESIQEMAEIADFQKMNDIRARVEEEVADPVKAEDLKPWYRLFCKRPTFNDMYLAAFNKESVHLIDVSEAKGVERITKTGLVANGEEIELDCIIYATGFEITTAATRRMDFEIEGRDGVSLFDHWGGGIRTLHGVASHGFPNWFNVGVNQNGFSPNMTAMFDDLAIHIGYIIDEAQKRQSHVVEVTKEAEQAWVEKIREMAAVAPNRDFLAECTPGYYNHEGQPDDAALQNTPYPGGINEFNAMLAKWREGGELDGFELS
ncbi:MAG: NAD(P)/FAD-dependent oxidoreductase [Pacificimonas sp.]|jgi:cyclohexanone monooxygenase|nr:NAD(P)/FAD-dependent oxidoreductase [Pacificimonas sp.]